MMHGTTSAFYPAIASLDVATAMMDGPQGRWLIDEAVTEAIRFRQAVVRTGRRISAAADRPDWFFGVWQPQEVTDPATGARIAFADAPAALLATDPSCWYLEPGASWHGFDGLTDGHCLLDPVKVTITCPGVTATGETQPWGVPARVLTEYLATRAFITALDDAFHHPPTPVHPPRHCYQQLIRGGTERVRLADAAGRIAAAMVTVTPPGIPVLMPGESLGAPDGPLLRYLTALQDFDRTFPGFGSEAHGITTDPDTGDYLVECLNASRHTGR
ncbi:Orn/Lys/Arg family decarboxylase [Streptomyces humi]